MKKRGIDGENRSNLLKGPEPEVIAAPGIKPIKKIELGTKWRPHVPPAFQDDICPIPSEEEIKMFKEERKKAQPQKKRRGTNKTEQRSGTTIDDHADLEDENEDTVEIVAPSGGRVPTAATIPVVTEAQLEVARHVEQLRETMNYNSIESYLGHSSGW